MDFIIKNFDKHDWIVPIILAVFSGLSYLYFRKKDLGENVIDNSIDICPKNEKTIMFSDDRKKSEFEIEYFVHKSEQHIQIKPELPYLKSLKNHEQIYALDINKSFFSPSPCIFIKITNNKKTTLRIDKLKFKIIYSKSIEKPLPIFNYMNGGKPFEVIIQNIGWGKILNSSIEYDFYIDKDDTTSISGNLQKFKKDIGTFDNYKHIDISDIFEEKWGFNISYLNSQKIVTDILTAKHIGFEEKNAEEIRNNIFKKIFDAYGSLQNKLSNDNNQPLIRIFIKGVFYYQYKENNEIYNGIPVNFIAPIWLCRKVAAGPIMPTPQSIYTIELELNRKNYNLLIDDSYVIKSGDTEVIQITFNCKQSSKHKINIIADTNQGKIDISNDILLEILKMKDNKA